MKLGMVINIYIDTQPGVKNIFDHPTSFNNFREENTFTKTLDSINNLILTEGDELTLYLFGIAVNEDVSCDEEIKELLNVIMQKSKYNYRIYTNSDINKLSRLTGSKFFSIKGYPEIRTLGLIIPTLLEEDVIIQIDDDELLRRNYLLAMKELLKSNPDKYLFTAPYEKNGTVDITARDKLKSWPKFASMRRDIQRLMRGEGLKETLFGFGGNMVIRSELARRSFYPFDVPRGEDFSFLLANRLIYENGNPAAGIQPHEDIFKAYFTPLIDMTIIHEPPSEAKADFIFYLEKNLKRFIMEWNMFANQSSLTIDGLKDLSVYLCTMFGYTDMEDQIMKIIAELKEYYRQEEIEHFSRKIFSFLDRYKDVDRFGIYREEQAEYIESIQTWSKDQKLRREL